MKYKQIKQMFTDLEKLKAKGIWFSGIENEGEYKVWHGNGKLHIHCFYKDGKRDGELKQWHFNGQLWIHCFYKDGIKHGECKRWHDNGKLSMDRAYKDGELIKCYL